MWRLVTRVFPLMLLVIFVSPLLFEKTVYYLFPDYWERLVMKIDSPEAFLLQQYLNSSNSAEQWQQRLQQYRQKRIIEELPLQDVLSVIPPEKQQQLLAEGIVLVIEPNLEFHYYLWFPNQNKLLNYNSITSPANKMLEQLRLIYYIWDFSLVLLIVTFWATMHWRDLLKLRRMAEKIRAGDFSARTGLRRYSSIRPISEGMDQMASHIQQLITSQRDLMHSVSHELRTPIARLEFGLALLQQETTSPPLLNRIDDMHSDLTELNTLVSELLQLTTLNQPHLLHREPFDMPQLLLQCQQRLAPLVIDKDIILQPMPDRLLFNGDQRLIARMLNNLLQNAIRYARKRVWLNVETLTDGRIEICVQDDGPGIPLKARPRIFEPFYRLERNWDKQTSGYGLGLSIVAQVVALHQGTIDIEDAKPQGAKFVLRFPGGG
ncbi:MAG: ATP-binding protein [Enterobacteriaceae bacterium]